MRKISYTKNPFLQGHDNLFDLTDEGELVNKFGAEEAVNSFITLWMETYDPFVSYPDIFPEDNSKEAELQLHHVKNFYKNFVYEGDWTDEKYVLVIEEIFKSHKKLSTYIVEEFGDKYDTGKLQFQLAERRRKRKRI